MSEGSNEVPWDEETEQFIATLDPIVMDKTGIGLRDLLLNSDKYIIQKEMAGRVEEVKLAVSDFFKGLLFDLIEEKNRLEGEMESAGMQYKKIDDVIIEKSNAMKIPYIKPLLVNFDTDTREEIVIAGYDAKTDGLVGKLASTATYVADISEKYRDVMLGSWLFSGSKTYLLRLKAPESIVMTIEDSEDAINDMLSDISNRIAIAESK